MLTQDQLIEKLITDRNKGFIDRLAVILKEQDFDIEQLIDLTFHPDKTLGFRAMWLLDTIMLSNLEHYAVYLPYLLSRIREVDNESCKRHYARIMLHMTMPNAPETARQTLEKTDLEDTVEQFFDWIINPKVKVAVKIFAADTLFNLSDRYDWIAEELANQMAFLMRTGGPAIQSRGRKLLAKLR